LDCIVVEFRAPFVRNPGCQHASYPTDGGGLPDEPAPPTERTETIDMITPNGDAEVRRPDLVIVDIKLPRADGMGEFS
jgi:hypothetical protein